ncbi:MAG: phosphoglucosamine mutase [Acidobacteria bacterium]|nr:phosphoglucosamine mutase [Acidobacteriota bacterium]
METARLFGTDGIRGSAGAWPLDPPTVARIGGAVVRALAYPAERPVRLLVGRDTRESGEWIERELARGAVSQGAVVESVGVMPTPGVAYLTRSRDVDLGVVISASHNPFHDNGIKVFSGRGEKFSEGVERTVEALVADTSWSVPVAGEARIERVDLSEDYLAHTALLGPAGDGLKGMRVALDLSNGATTTTARRLFESLGCTLVLLGDAPTGQNINLACGSTHPASLAAAVVAQGCQLGVAFDGDGDRAILIDHRGRVVDGDSVLLLLGLHYQRQGRLTGNTVVATVMSNIGLEIALRDWGIAMIRTAVGDKYVMETMLKHGFVVGGEQSGHVILAEHLFTGDGMATALAVMRVMVESGQSLAELASALIAYPQTLVNVRVRERVDVDLVPAVAAAMARVREALGSSGRLLVRYSGTEPLLRIMIEGEDQVSIRAWAEEIADAVRTTLA